MTKIYNMKDLKLELNSLLKNFKYTSFLTYKHDKNDEKLFPYFEKKSFIG